jgi:ATP-binding cassette, subfamily B, bacterial MsbA
MIQFLRRLWTYVRPYRSRLILGQVCGIISALTNGLLISAIPVVVGLVFPGTSPPPLNDQLAKSGTFLRKLVEWFPELQSPSSKVGTLLIISTIPMIMLVRGLFGYLNVYLTNWSAARAIASLRATIFDHLQNLPLSFFSQARTGDLIARVTSDTHMLYAIIGNSFALMVREPVTVIVALTVLLTKQPELTLISVIVLPIAVVCVTFYSRKIRRAAKAMQGHNAELVNLMHESFTGNRVVKAYNMEEAVSGQFREITKKYISHMMRSVRATELPSQFTEFMGGVGIALVLAYVVLFLGGKPDTADFIQFVIGIVLMYQPIKALARLHNQLNQAQAASARVFELLDMPSTVVEPASPVPLQAANADIHFDHVDFDYAEKPVLRGINLTVKAGQLVALVGHSGSGKTTITNLLLRFYDPRHGVIRIGSTDIRQVTTKDLRRQIALVTQETILFHDTIRHNIALGRPGATNAEIEAAARSANAHEFVAQRPDGYDAVVGEKGIALSGGQRQRVSIARAILKNAPILILDEATNALDAESERTVQAELEKLMQGRTTICIAHRLSTIQKADLIVVLDQGRIVETGTHAELLRRGGVYQRLYELQFQN